VGVSFLYPRTISITRMNQIATVGVVDDYAGESEQGETTIYSGLPANIAQNRQRTAMEAGVPQDATSRTGWAINIPLASSPPAGSIVERDIVVDDIGKRYIINGAGYTSLGWRLVTELMKA
jgi:hypothetical protein